MPSVLVPRQTRPIDASWRLIDWLESDQDRQEPQGPKGYQSRSRSPLGAHCCPSLPILAHSRFHSLPHLHGSANTVPSILRRLLGIWVHDAVPSIKSTLSRSAAAQKASIDIVTSAMYVSSEDSFAVNLLTAYHRAGRRSTANAIRGPQSALTDFLAVCWAGNITDVIAHSILVAQYFRAPNSTGASAQTSGSPAASRATKR